MSARQLALSFPALARDPAVTYVDAGCQAEARRVLGAWREWPGGILALTGPEGSGKSHLAALWARAANARIVDAAALDGAVGNPPSGWVIEDADRAPNEAMLLAWLERARSGAAGPLLFTGREAPANWAVTLPDLRSRLILAPVVRIGDPSDEDLAAVFAKELADRGADASEALIGYVVRRIERSFAAAAALARELDRAALERKQRVTRALAADVLGAADDET